MALWSNSKVTTGTNTATIQNTSHLHYKYNESFVSSMLVLIIQYLTSGSG